MKISILIMLIVNCYGKNENKFYAIVENCEGKTVYIEYDELLRKIEFQKKKNMMQSILLCD